MNRGNTDGAAYAAFQMIQFYRVAVDKYAAIAAAAGEKGKTDVMVLAAMKAYGCSAPLLRPSHPRGVRVAFTTIDLVGLLAIGLVARATAAP
jgi:hypothetical protein